MFKLNRGKHTRKWVPAQAWRKMARVCLLGFVLCAVGLGYEYSSIHRTAQQLAPLADKPAKTLDIVTRVSPNTYFESDRGPSGFEYALLEMFAAELDRELVVHTTDTLDELFGALKSNKAVLASAGLTPTRQRRQRFLFSAPYLESKPIVIYRVGTSRPRKTIDLVGRKVVVVADSSHSAALRKAQKTHPQLQWREVDEVDFTALLALVEQGVIDHTIIDSAEFMLQRGSFPSLKRAFDIAKPSTFNWMFAKNVSSESMRVAANKFLQRIRSDGTLARLEERFFGQSSEVGQDAAHEFAKNMRTRLPRYIDKIKQVAEQFDMDWRLLAAISYQESSWNPRAKSPTGVRGMMMLTLPTARELGIKNRLDIDQSLSGGARYYRQLKARLPKRIAEPDRSWFALAAYNVGMGHLEDARRLTQKRGLNPDSWYHVKEALPLLSQPEWYKKTRYGYARGHEPVQYVQRIRHYYNVLVWRELAHRDKLDLNADALEALLGSDWLASETKPVVTSQPPVAASTRGTGTSDTAASSATFASAADLLGVESPAESTNSL